jgi:hypothetical protein
MESGVRNLMHLCLYREYLEEQLRGVDGFALALVFLSGVTALDWESSCTWGIVWSRLASPVLKLDFNGK